MAELAEKKTKMAKSGEKCVCAVWCQPGEFGAMLCTLTVEESWWTGGVNAPSRSLIICGSPSRTVVVLCVCVHYLLVRIYK